jgi:hypothetical protein
MATSDEIKKMTDSEKLDLILANQSILFWRLTAAPGVARFASDVQRFTAIEVALGIKGKKEGTSLVNGYRASEKQKPLKGI